MTDELMMVLDTETLGNVDERSTLRTYDFGYLVRDRAGDVYEAGSFVVSDIFYNMEEQMRSAYYANKLPQYHRGIGHLGAWEPISMLNLKKLIDTTVKDYGIKRVFAYNAGFDRGALNATIKHCSNGFVNFFMPYGVEYCDIWKPACDVIMNNRNYFAFAQANGLVSEKGNVRTSAEACYSYLIGDANYSECHTGLEDVMIESAILTALFQSKKKLDFSVSGSPWRVPQKKFKKWASKQVAK